MSEAPERIWVEKSISESGNHGSTAWPDNDGTETDIEYVRADRIEELEGKLTKAVAFIETIKSGPLWGTSMPEWINGKMLKASAVLTELKGDKDG